MKLTGILAAAGFLALSGLAGAAPISQLPMGGDIAGGALIEKVHGDHRSCEEGRRGWHRHDRYGDRIPCNPPHYGNHRHQGHEHHGYRKPQRSCFKDWHCEKAGPFGVGKKCYWRDICN